MKVLTTIGCVAALSAGCLPRGAPPAGQQILADRQASLGAVVPPNGDGMLRVLFLRQNATDAAGSDLYVVSVDPSGLVSPERLLLQDINTEFGLGCTWRIAPCQFDAKGRALVYTNTPSGQPDARGGVSVVDPVTGEVTKTPVIPSGIQSSDGQRRFEMDQWDPLSPTPPTGGTLIEADGRTTRIELGSDQLYGQYVEFIVDDFYYIDQNSDLIDIPPSGVPQQVAAGVTNVQHWMTPDGLLLLLYGPTADPLEPQLRLRDPVTGTLTTLPFTGTGGADWSSDYRFMVYTHESYDTSTNIASYTHQLFDRTSGAAQALDIPSTLAVQTQWRPGHHEFWAGSEDDRTTPVIFIFTPSAPTVTLTGIRFRGISVDGVYWFSTTDDPNKADQVLDVGLADDPTGPRYPLNAPGTALGPITELPEGRLLAETYTNDVQREDVIAVDPRTGASQLLAERGMIAALGQTRFMGMFHYQGGRGDLTFVELDTGRSTILAPEFTVTAFAEPQGPDDLAPGTRVVYQFQARTASSWDGIWLVNSP